MEKIWKFRSLSAFDRRISVREPFIEQSDAAVENVMQRFRSVHVTLAEAKNSPAYRGDVEASDLVQHRHQQIGNVVKPTWPTQMNQ